MQPLLSNVRSHTVADLAQHASKTKGGSRCSGQDTRERDREEEELEGERKKARSRPSRSGTFIIRCSIEFASKDTRGACDSSSSVKSRWNPECVHREIEVAGLEAAMRPPRRISFPGGPVPAALPRCCRARRMGIDRETTTSGRERDAA